MSEPITNKKWLEPLEEFKKQSKHLAKIRGILFERRIHFPTFNEMLVAMNREAITDENMALDNLVDLIVFGVPKDCHCGGEVRYSEKHQAYFCLRNPSLISGFSPVGSSNRLCGYLDTNPPRDPFEMPEQFKKQMPWFPLKKKSAFPFRAYADGHLRRECESTAGRMLVKRGTVVDGQFLEANQCHLLKGNDGGLCSAVLVYCDVRGDINNFIRLQLYEHDVETVAYLHVGSGRIGAKRCVVERNMYGDRDQAVEQFEKLFLEYTSNEWTNRKSFVPVPGMMMFLELDYMFCVNQLHAQLGAGENVLHPDVRNLVETIYAANATAVRTASFNLDMEVMPMGPPARQHINEAYVLLSLLEQFLDSANPNMDKIFEASSRFYTIFPTSYGEEPMRPVDSLEILVEKSSMLHTLDDAKYEFVITVPPASTQEDSPSPYDPYNPYGQFDFNRRRERLLTAAMSTEQLYKRLNCDIQVVEHHSDEFRDIQAYLHNTGNSSGLRLVDLFRLKRDSEPVTFRSSIGNRLLLWHGSNVANLPSILSMGLKVDPPSGVFRCGLDFGRGVYFADTADLSQEYCRATQGFDLFLLLSDVALGRIQYTDRIAPSQTPNTTIYDSYLGGSGTLAEPGQVIQHPDGYGIPVHTKKQSYPNEYIVFNSDQVNLKYLVRARRWNAEHVQY